MRGGLVKWQLFAKECFLVIAVGKTAWNQLIELYPYLVDCTTTSSSEVSRSLREALLQYCDLLQPLHPASSGGSVGGGGPAATNGLSSSHC